MAQEAQAHESPVPVGRSRSSSSTSPASGMWKSPRQMQAHTPFPSWIPYAGTFAAEPSLQPGEHGRPDHAGNQSAPSMGAHGGSGYRGNFLSSLLEAKTVTPDMLEDDDDDDDVPAACDYQAVFLQRMVLPSRVELQSILGYSGMVSETERLESCLPDAASFSDYNRSSADFMSSISKRQEQDVQRQQQGMGGSSRSGSGAATSVATRRKSEERVGGDTKKSKQEASRKTSPPKPQAPKVKLGEKITALQQIVSPFGKTDTSSVLFETIEYIKFLHEQIRLFSDPYMTKSTYKGHIRREKEEESQTAGHDLRGRGLCLVPVSLTSQAYHDDTLPDCWAPAYRSCLYP